MERNKWIKDPPIRYMHLAQNKSAERDLDNVANRPAQSVAKKRPKTVMQEANIPMFCKKIERNVVAMADSLTR